MNFLAHVQLSCEVAEALVGNLAADGYKGNKYLQLPPGMQQGVLLHRKIDFVTDSSDTVKALKKVLSPYFGRYAPVAIDVYFDHFLSVLWHRFYAHTLEEAVNRAHDVFAAHLHAVNADSRLFLQRLIQYRWLLAYKDPARLEVIFNQMSHRFGVPAFANSRQPLHNHYHDIEASFLTIYPVLMQEARIFLGLG